ncbi:MAG: VWA domain-containing protein [Bacteroidales bacterium]|nr:VWA domain-containing protein [Candidatus Colimorpha onthohippi]
MLHFQYPQLLWLLLIIPVLLATWLWLQHAKRQQLLRFADGSMFGRLIPDASSWRPLLKLILALVALACIIIAIANPQMGSKMVKGERQGSDIAICLDISNSMMAEDLQPNRLERGKRVVTTLMNQMTGDRVALVVFAGSSFIQMPLTNDYSALRLFLDQIDCNLISTQGTAIGDAINKAMTAFGYGDPDREWAKNKGRSIVVISDGENFEDDAVEAASDAAAEGVMVCTIGMGLADGVPIPNYNTSGVRTGYKQDADGNIVTTHLDEQTLSQIAHAGKGVYVRAGSVNTGFDEIVDEIQKLEKDSYGEQMFAEYESQYQYPLAAALVCLIVEISLFARRNRKINWDWIIKR